MPVDLRPIKADLRREALALREALAPDAVREYSAAIAEHVTALPIFHAAQTVAGYMAMRAEVHAAAILDAAFAQGKRVVLPRTLRDERRLVLHHVHDLGQVQPGPCGILEPFPDAPTVDPAAVELFLVPGVVFDAAGNRIGYGAGFYDSLLVLSEGWRVALAYTRQMMPHVPSAEHDMPMDLIATERGLIDCGKGQQTTDHLRLHNMIFYGHHGAFPQEREHGIRFAVDLDLRVDLQLPGLTDDLATTVNYPAAYRLIQRIQSERQFALFETMVEHIASAVLAEFAAVEQVSVRARKFNPPVGGPMDAFEVEISRSRPAWMRPYGA